MNQTKLLVSVIITNYNYGNFIGESIESVLNQSYPRFELIIVDDGSTDNSREVISSFNNSRINKIFKNNGGQASALNAGLSIAKGEIIAFLDSDDIWKTNKLEECVKAYLDNDEYNIVQHNLEIITQNSLPTGKIHPGIRPGRRDVFRAYIKNNHTGFFTSTSGITCKSNNLKKILPLDNSWRICADVTISRPLALFGKTLTLNKQLGFYRIHDSNKWMNSDNQKKQLENQQKYVDYTNYWLAKFGYIERIDFKKSNIYKTLINSKSNKNKFYHKILSKLIEDN